MRVHGGRLRRQPDLQFLRLRACNKAKRGRSRDDKPETNHKNPSCTRAHLRPAQRQMQAGMAGIRRVTLRHFVRNA
jgi:hypothetical protein